MVVYGKTRAGRTKEAVEYVEKLIEVEPEEVEWRLLQAVSYELTVHLAKAKRINEILEERPLLVMALLAIFWLRVPTICLIICFLQMNYLILDRRRRRLYTR